MPRAVVVSPSLFIPAAAFTVTHARSSGPGGQNVNKVNSKVVLRWQVAASPHLPDGVRARFLAAYANRINADGELILTADGSRDQSRNIAACLEKVRAMTAAVLLPPRPRKKSRPPRAAIEKRMEEKRRVSQTKRRRSFRDEARE